MQNSVIFSRVCIGDSDIAGANSIVGSSVESYTIVIRNLARMTKKVLGGIIYVKSRRDAEHRNRTIDP